MDKTVSDEVAKFIGDTRLFVTATNDEMFLLWMVYAKQAKNGYNSHDFSSYGYGYGTIVGHVGDMPVFISILDKTIDGVRAIVIDPTSQVVDHRMVRDWITSNFKGAEITDVGNLISTVNRINFEVARQDV